MSFDPAAAITGDAKAGLKHTEAPEVKAAKPEDDPQFAGFVKIFDDNGGDLAAISAVSVPHLALVCVCVYFCLYLSLSISIPPTDQLHVWIHCRQWAVCRSRMALLAPTAQTSPRSC